LFRVDVKETFFLKKKNVIKTIKNLKKKKKKKKAPQKIKYQHDISPLSPKKKSKKEPTPQFLSVPI
jgi:hypothetical protein